jgi:hypothetical protein
MDSRARRGAGANTYASADAHANTSADPDTNAYADANTVTGAVRRRHVRDA